VVLNKPLGTNECVVTLQHYKSISAQDVAVCSQAVVGYTPSDLSSLFTGSCDLVNLKKESTGPVISRMVAAFFPKKSAFVQIVFQLSSEFGPHHRLAKTTGFC
jgi:hypothetical protein